MQRVQYTALVPGSEHSRWRHLLGSGVITCGDARCPRVVIAGNATKGRCGQLRLGLLIPAAGSATLGDSVALSRSGSFQASGYLRRVDRRGNSEVAKRFGDRRRLGPESLV